MSSLTERDKLINRRKLEFAVWRKTFEKSHRAWQNAPGDLKSALLLEGDGLGRAEFWLMDFSDRFSESERQFIRVSLMARPIYENDSTARFIKFARRNSYLVLLPAFVTLFFTGFSQLQGLVAHYNEGLLATFDKANLHRKRTTTAGAQHAQASGQRRETLVTDDPASMRQPDMPTPVDEDSEPEAARFDERRPLPTGARRAGPQPTDTRRRHDAEQAAVAHRPAVPTPAKRQRADTTARRDETPLVHDRLRRLIEASDERWNSGDTRTALLLAIEAARIADRSGMPTYGPYAGLPNPATLILRAIATKSGSIVRHVRLDAATPALFCADRRAFIVADGTGAIAVWRIDAMAEGPRMVEGAIAGLAGAAVDSGCGRLTVGADEHAVEVWSLSEGRRQFLLEGHEAEVLSAAFSPDGRTIVTAGQDRSVRIWDGDSGRQRLVLQDHDDVVSSIALDASGRLALTASVDRTARLFDIGSGRLLATLRGHAGPVTSAVLTPDARLALTTSTDGSAALWEVASGRMTRRLKSQRSSILSARLSRSGASIATLSDAGEVLIWATATDAAPIVLATPGSPVREARFSASGQTLVVLHWNGEAGLYASATGRRVATINGVGRRIAAIGVSSEGDRMTVLQDDGTVLDMAMPATLDALVQLALPAASDCLTNDERQRLGLVGSPPAWCSSPRVAAVDEAVRP